MALYERVETNETEVVRSFDPTTMTDAEATRMGFKSYYHGTSYNGSNAPTVTLDAGDGTITTMYKAAFVPRQLQDGTWRMRININASVTAAVTPSVILDGVALAEVTSLATIAPSNTAASHAFMTTGGQIYRYTEFNYTSFMVMGDVELSSKPTWAV